MYYDPKFAAMLTEVINEPFLSEVEKYGYCHHEDEFRVNGVIVRLGVYELDNKTYIIKYVGDECVIFRDITVGPRN